MHVTIDPAVARTWCEGVARELDVQRIDRGDGRPYLERYFAAGWRPAQRVRGPGLFLHHFVASDGTDTMHSHPWTWSASLILVGGYREERCVDGRRVTRVYWPGDVNVLAADAVHRIDLLEADCWTLFLVGDYAQPWTFVPRCGGD